LYSIVADVSTIVIIYYVEMAFMTSDNLCPILLLECLANETCFI